MHTRTLIRRNFNRLTNPLIGRCTLVCLVTVNDHNTVITVEWVVCGCSELHESSFQTRRLHCDVSTSWV